MKLRFDKALLFRAFAYLLFILLAPFAFELVIMADIVGIEAAIAFLMFYGKSVAIQVKTKCVLAFGALYKTIQSAPGTVRYNQKAYAIGVLSSFALFCFTGSILVSLVGWLASAMDLAHPL